jgi:hypothetical protein
MIILEFTDCYTEGAAAVPLASVASFKETSGVLHVTTLDGAEHHITTTWGNVKAAIAQYSRTHTGGGQITIIEV